MEGLFSTLGVSEEAKQVSPDQLVRLYQERMSVVESECVQDLTELFLENIELFKTDPEWDVLLRVQQQLKHSERYQRLEFRPDIRKSMLIKHIVNLQWPEKGPYAHSPLLGPLKESAPRELLLPLSSPGSEGLRWVLDPTDQSYNLAILGRTKDNALTLRSDFLNHLSGSGVCEVGGKKYNLQLEVFHGEELDSITAQDFTPQGAVAVATSMVCIDWLEGLLARLWMPSGQDNPGYRGMPLVILALDTGVSPDEGPPVDTPLFCRAKALAHRLQCVLVADRPTVMPKRLVVSGVVPRLLSALMDATSYCHDFLHSQLDKQEEGLNVAVCSLTGEPYSPSDFLAPLLRHQLVWYSEDSRTLFLGLTLEKQHRTCALTFHSALNPSTDKSSVHLGYILVYSSQRPASLAVIRHMHQQLPGIPMLVVAMETKGSQSKLLEEGRRLAEQWGATFISSGQKEWDAGCTTEFFSKCWFSRFSSWSDEVKQRIRKRRPQPLPSRPLPKHSSFPDELAIAAESLEDSEYALVADHRLLDKLKSLRSPSTSPPPPTSPPPQTNDEVEDGSYVYAMVRNPPQYRRPPVPKRNVYDHLKESVAQQGYDRLAPKDNPYAFVIQSNKAQQEPPTDQLYSVVHKPPKPRSRKPPLQLPESQKPPLQQTLEPLDQLYSVVNKPPKPLRQQSESPLQWYSVVSEPKARRKPSVEQPESQDELYSVVARWKSRMPPRQQPKPRDDLYSVVTKSKSRMSPLQQLEPYNQPLHQPPPVAPKPQDRPRRSPTLIDSKHSAEPADGSTIPDSSPKPGRQWDSPRQWRTNQSSSNEMTLSPRGSTSPELARASTRPRTGVLGREHAWSDDEGEGVGEWESEDVPALPERRYSPSELGLDDEAPLLPPRYYSWSDVEDNDEEVLLSDDDLDDLITTSLTLSDHQAIYASVKRLSTVRPNYGGIEAIYNVVSKMTSQGPTPPQSPVASTAQDGSPVDSTAQDGSPVTSTAQDGSPVTSTAQDGSPVASTTQDGSPVASTAQDGSPVASTVQDGSPVDSTVQDGSPVASTAQDGSPVASTAQDGSPVDSTAQDDPVYDKIESVMQSMPRPPQSPGQVQVQELLPTSPTRGTPPGGLAGIPFTARLVKLIKQQKNLLEKLQKKVDREAERRRKQEAKQHCKEEEKGWRKGRKTRSKELDKKCYFGSPLEVVAGEDGVPVLVKKCTQFLEDTGLKSKGLYGVSGKKEICMALQEMVDKDSNLDLASLGYSESAVSSTLKAFFKLLPDPLISNDIAARFLDVNSLRLDEQQVKLRQMLGTLPQPNLCTLRFLLFHLNKVQSLQKDNRMTASNLAIVFWPTLMRPPLIDLADPSKQMGWQLVMTRLIKHPDCVPLPQ